MNSEYDYKKTDAKYYKLILATVLFGVIYRIIIGFSVYSLFGIGASLIYILGRKNLYTGLKRKHRYEIENWEDIQPHAYSIIKEKIGINFFLFLSYLLTILPI